MPSTAKNRQKPAHAKPPAQRIPQFALYGDNAPLAGNELVHIELIETRSRLYDWEISSHTHSGLFQILVLFSGHVSARIDAETWECDGPCALTIHPTVVHGFRFSANTNGYVLTMDQSVLLGLHADTDGDLFSGLFLQPLALDLRADADALERIAALLRHLLDEFSRPQSGHTRLLDWLTRCVMLLLARRHVDSRRADLSGRGDFELFSRLRASIEENYKAQWNIARHAAALHVTESRLNRLCLRLAGKSAFELLLQRLMLEACRKLTYIPASIASIAYELGYQDPAYFSRVFKRHTGLTPKRFREQARMDGGAGS